jgi:hypothetical protein
VETFSNSNDYATYDDAFVKHDHKAYITFTVKSTQGGVAPAMKGVKKHHILFWTIDWAVDLDGKDLSKDKLIVEHDPESSEETEVKKDLWGDERHRYVLTYILNGMSAQVEIQAQYAEYK